MTEDSLRRGNEAGFRLLQPVGAEAAAVVAHAGLGLDGSRADAQPVSEAVGVSVVQAFKHFVVGLQTPSTG